MMKIPLCIRKNYIIHVEFFDSVYWIHMDVFKWSQKVKTDIISELKEISDLVKMPLRCIAMADNKKLQKFSKILGCVCEAELITKDGLALVYKWG